MGRSGWTTLGIATLAAASLGGCGGGGDDAATGPEQPAPPPRTEPVQTAGAEMPPAPTDGPDGRQLFATTCGGCHTLQVAGTSGQVGPNLDDRRPSAEEVREAIRTGPGTMPEDLLQGEDAEAVAQFVAENAGG